MHAQTWGWVVSESDTDSEEDAPGMAVDNQHAVSPVSLPALLGRAWSGAPRIAKAVFIVIAGGALIAAGSRLNHGRISTLRTQAAEQRARADGLVVAVYQQGSDNSVQVTALQQTLSDQQSQLEVAQAQLNALYAKLADVATQGESTSNSPTPPTPGTGVDLLSPATLRNPGASVGGLACELQNSGLGKALGSAKCVWNGTSWVPTNQ